MLLAFFFLNTIVQASLVLPVERTTGLGCIPEGRTVSYECTVTDTSNPLIGFTLWTGSAFNCPDSSSSRINLGHSLFEPNGVSGSCGDLSAMSVTVNGNDYVSSLTLIATTDLNGTTVECTLSAVTDFGNDTIKTGALPPPPQGAMVDVTSSSSLTVSWTASSDTTNVDGYMVKVTGEDCGCESMNVSASTTSVLCSGWMSNNQNCSFEMSTISQDCGFFSTVSAPTSVVLSVPSSPSQLSLGNLQQTCSFENTNANLSWTAPSAMSSYPTVEMYSVRVNMMSTIVNMMSTMGTETSITIPGSSFPRAGTYSFSVRAVNILGEGAPLMADFDVVLTTVSSSYTATMTSITLTFSLSNTGCSGSANVTVYNQECADQVNCQCPQDASFSTNERSTSATEALVITGLRAGVIYCYRSEVMNAGTIVGFENGRMFTTTPPVPPATIASARLVSSNPPVYQCVNSVEGFNGGSSQTRALFDSTTGTYSIPPCSLFVWLIVVIVILVIVLVVGLVVGVILTLYCVKKHKDKADDEKEITEKISPPPDSLYADPNAIEHEAAPGTEDQYAMVVKDKKNKKPKAAQPDALYQDPNTIEHETAASGDTYAVVDKPKRSSKKKGEPDVVPPANEGLMYAEIDMSKPPKGGARGSGRQAAQQPGELPVEYSSVDHSKL